MQSMKRQAVILRVDLKELAVIKKAAKAERRSMTQFFVMSALEAASRLSPAKIKPSSALSEEASA